MSKNGAMRRLVAVPARPVASRAGDVEERIGVGAGHERRDHQRHDDGGAPEHRRRRQPVRPRAALRHQPAAPLVEERQVLREHERTGGDAEADGEQHLRVVGAERRRPHEEHQRG